MKRFMLTCAAALLGASSIGCDYEPICPTGYDFDQASSLCLFVGDAGGPAPTPPDSGMVGADAGSDAGTAEDAGESDAGDGDAGGGSGGGGGMRDR